MLGNRADAEDAVQRALLKCFAARATYSPQWAVSTWLYRALSNVCIDELRRRACATEPDLDVETASSGAPGGASRDSPPSSGCDLTRALATVPREARLLLALHYVDGLGYRRAGEDPRHLGQHGQEPARARQGDLEARAGGRRTTMDRTDDDAAGAVRGAGARRRWPAGCGAALRAPPPTLEALARPVPLRGQRPRRARGSAYGARARRRPPARGRRHVERAREELAEYLAGGRDVLHGAGGPRRRAPSSRTRCWPRRGASRSARCSRTRRWRGASGTRGPRGPSATRSAPTRCRCSCPATA